MYKPQRLRTVHLWLWPGKNQAQGLTSMPKDLESRTNWNAHTAQTDGR